MNENRERNRRLVAAFSDIIREDAQETGYDPVRARWETLVFAEHGYSAIVGLLDYALAMCLWTGAEEARQRGETTVSECYRDYRVVYLVGLALYVAAERSDTHDLSYVDMRPAVALLGTDAQARDIALVEPGDRSPESRFRTETRQMLDALLAPESVAEWEQISDVARHVVTTNADSFLGKAFLFPRNSEIAAFRIRRRWYLTPDLSPIVPDDVDENGA